MRSRQPRTVGLRKRFSTRTTLNPCRSRSMSLAGSAASLARVLTASRALGCLDIYPNIDRARRVLCARLCAWYEGKLGFQALSGRNNITDNLCYNGPRAGVNFNDGFLGGAVGGPCREPGRAGQQAETLQV